MGGTFGLDQEREKKNCSKPWVWHICILFTRGWQLHDTTVFVATL